MHKKALDKTKHSFLRKTLNKLGTEGITPPHKCHIQEKKL